MPLIPLNQRQTRWIRRFSVLVVVGIMAFVIGVDPGLIGIDLTPVVGLAQMSLWLAGLAMVLIGGC